MKQNRLPLMAILAALVLWAGCLIVEVEQPQTVEQGEVITIRVTIEDEETDENAWEGIFAIMVPEDWDFVSATYDSDLGEGDMNLFEAWADSMQQIRPPDEGMKWIATLSDEAYEVPSAPVFHEVEINLQVGQIAGDFPLGYFVAKNAYNNVEDMMAYWEFGSADTSMNHNITVQLGTNLEDLLVDGVPHRISLEQNYPNPFNPSTNIRYALNETSPVRLAVYDLRGREIAVLDDGVRGAGIHTVRFDAANLATGVYLYKLEAAGETITRSMIYNR